MKKKFNEMLCFLLCMSMLLAMLAGCSNNSQTEQTESEETVEGTATSVAYNVDGKFTTTVTAENAKFSEGLEAADVSVRYTDLKNTKVNIADVESLEDLEDAEIEEADIEYATVDAAIESVTRKDDTTIEITFTDTTVKDNAPTSYYITVDDDKTGLNKEVSAFAEVEYECDILKSNIDCVLDTDKDIRLTLELTDGSYEENVTSDQIQLGGSFESLTIDNISSAGKNLTMQLTGDLSKHESSGAYLDGTVTVDKSAIVDAPISAQITIPVGSELSRFDSEKISVDGSTATVPLILMGVTDIDALNKDSIRFENDVTVTEVKKDSDTQVTLTLDVNGATDKNSAAAILDGQTVTVGDEYSFTAAFVSAGFYPVFDYVEEKDDNLELTLELYANSGIFAEELSAEDISLGDDFEDGDVISIEKLSDSSAELIISVPAGDQTAEDLDLTGKVILSAGTLVNEWGDASSEEISYSRNYSQESMGRDLSATDIDAIKDIVGGFGNTTFGTISSIASGAGTGYEVIKTILEMTGVIQSEHAQVMEKLDSISAQISEVQDTLNSHTKMLNDLSEMQYMQSLREFNVKFFQLESYCNCVAKYFKNAKSESFQNKLSVKMPAELTDAEKKDSNKVAEYTEQLSQYNDALIKEMEEAEKTDNKFKDFKKTMQNLESLFIEVTSYLKVQQNNPIDIFDKTCTYIYNFDTSAYDIRQAYRTDIINTLSRTVNYISAYYSTVNPKTENAAQEYIKAYEMINSRPVSIRTDGKAYCYIKNVDIYTAGKVDISNTELGKLIAPQADGYGSDESWLFSGHISIEPGKLFIEDNGSCFIFSMINSSYVPNPNDVWKIYENPPMEFVSVGNEHTLFCERMEKRKVTLRQELTSANINVPDNTSGLLVRVDMSSGVIIGSYIKWDTSSEIGTGTLMHAIFSKGDLRVKRFIY